MKAGVIGLVKELARNMLKTGITINGLAPGCDQNSDERKDGSRTIGIHEG